MGCIGRTQTTEASDGHTKLQRMTTRSVCAAGSLGGTSSPRQGLCSGSVWVKNLIVLIGGPHQALFYTNLSVHLMIYLLSLPKSQISLKLQNFRSDSAAPLTNLYCPHYPNNPKSPNNPL